MRDQLDHLPAGKQCELAHVARVLFEEFSVRSAHRRMCERRFEISLILLRPTDFDETVETAHIGVTERDCIDPIKPEGVEPILHPLDLDDDEAIATSVQQPFATLGDETLTREVEAQLVR
ncbi:MAG: hypothetical protein WC729_09265 [Sphingomonas sp.]|jgi:hypothetical protein|uniref:hypothetical protein n=1 Tax=Sphingomonas sp. TaxID=28214 RepID=UPI0035640C2C